MPSLEYIVRPYQSPNSRGQVIIPSTPQNTRQKATLTWGAKTDAKQFTVNVTLQKDKEDYYETNRDGETVRIYGHNTGAVALDAPDAFDDSPPYIDVFRAKKLYLDKVTTQDINASDPQMTQSSYTQTSTDPNIQPASGTSTDNIKATMTLDNNTAAAQAQ